MRTDVDRLCLLMVFLPCKAMGFLNTEESAQTLLAARLKSLGFWGLGFRVCSACAESTNPQALHHSGR